MPPKLAEKVNLTDVTDYTNVVNLAKFSSLTDNQAVPKKMGR